METVSWTGVYRSILWQNSCSVGERTSMWRLENRSGWNGRACNVSPSATWCRPLPWAQRMPTRSSGKVGMLMRRLERVMRSACSGSSIQTTPSTEDVAGSGDIATSSTMQHFTLNNFVYESQHRAALPVTASQCR